MPPNQPPLNFPPPPKRVDFLGPLLKAAQLKFQRQQIEATRVFRERRLEQGDIGLGFERRRVEALETKIARPESLFQKPQIEDFTPESIERFRTTRNPAELVPREKIEGTLFQKPAIEKFTPESIKRFRTTKNPADVVPRGKKEARLRAREEHSLKEKQAPNN